MQKRIVRIYRGQHNFGLLRRLEVFVNGQLAGHVASGVNQDFEIATGGAAVYVKMDWCKSQVMFLNFDSLKTDLIVLGVDLPSVPFYSMIFEPSNFFKLKILSEDRKGAEFSGEIG